jgi:hypothetical protein
MTEVKPPSMQSTAQLIAVAVIQMQADGQTGLDDGRLHQLDEIGVVCVGAGALGHLKDQAERFRSLAASVMPWTISILLTLNAPMAYPPVIGLFEHFGCCYQRHNILFLSFGSVNNSLFLNYTTVSDNFNLLQGIH